MIKNPRTEESTSNTIPVGIARQMTKAFRDIQTQKKGEFTEAAWFPANQITQISANLEKCEADGLRIYFGRYTEDIINQINKLPYGDKIPPGYKDMNCVILVITKMIEGKAKTDYVTDRISKHTMGGSLPNDPNNRAELCPTSCDVDSELMKPY